MPEVSIIVATYNADWQKLMMTINSIIIQSGVKFEIIFADDGSKIKWNDKIRRYLRMILTVVLLMQKKMSVQF